MSASVIEKQMVYRLQFFTNEVKHKIIYPIDDQQRDK